MLSRIDEGGNEGPLRAPEAARVLVVDDCCDTAYICAKVLRSAGFEVVTAFDGFEALKVASEFLPRVTLLDIGLPDIDGFEVGRRLRADCKLKKMTLVALTAFASDDAQSPRWGVTSIISSLNRFRSPTYSIWLSARRGIPRIGLKAIRTDDSGALPASWIHEPEWAWTGPCPSMCIQADSNLVGVELDLLRTSLLRLRQCQSQDTELELGTGFVGIDGRAEVYRTLE